MSDTANKPAITFVETVPGKVDSISGEVGFDTDDEREAIAFLEKAIHESLPEWARGGKVRVSRSKPAPPSNDGA